MYTVNVDKECGCFRRSALENNLQIESKDDALLKAMEMKNTMNQKFCGKHDFDVVEAEDKFIIKFAQDVSSSQNSGCCGGGCGH